MEFTYKSYKCLIETLKRERYFFSDYHNWSKTEKCVILRHDIDYDIKKAVKFAIFEHEEGVQSTYFVLLTSGFYNVFSKESCDCLKRIADAGHEIGLHFDEIRYSDTESNFEKISELIHYEAEILGRAIGKEIRVVSMHRPSKGLLESNLEIPGLINSYSQTFFKDFKYLSDSRRQWREPIEEIIHSGEYNRLHILTHAFWYNEIEQDIKSSLLMMINSGNRDRYEIMNENFTKLGDIVAAEDVIGGDL